jgi:hypothetical protein
VTDFNDFWRTVASTPTSSGQQPSVRNYVMVRIADNLAFLVCVAVLIGLTIFFALYGLSGGVGDERAKWALNAAHLCLGVFLGLFAGKAVK